MPVTRKVLAFDLGASSGRAMLGSFDGEKILLEEIHRFSNDSDYVNGTLYWDTLHQLHEIKNGLVKCRIAGGADSIGIDTWGVDFGLLDKSGFLLENPVHYRDKRTNGMIKKAASMMPFADMYKETGIQFQEYNTVFQLLSLAIRRPKLLEHTDKLLLTPDLMSYFLTGEKHTEYTIASTTQLLNAHTRRFSLPILKKLGLPKNIFAPIVEPGTPVGRLSRAVCDELMVSSMPVIATASHDTASAVAAVPVTSGNFAYISSGTWSLLGTELDAPVITEQSMNRNFTNEGGADGKIRFLKNLAGLWLIQESRRQWIREGNDITFAQIENKAQMAKPFNCFIDPDSDKFAVPGDMPSRIRLFCRETGQHVPQNCGEIARCIYESLALKYRLSFQELEETTGKHFPCIHVIGGGTKDRLLSALTANACAREVIAGPTEATVIGNIAVQLMSLGEISSLAQSRSIIANSFELEHFEPQKTDEWDNAAERFQKLIDSMQK